MKRQQQILKYEGNNEKLFEKISCDDFQIGDVIIVPETHNAILLKDGELMNTLNSGKYDIFESEKKGFFHKREKTTCTVDVIYMSKTAKLRVFWGTKTQFDLRDPITNIPIKVGGSGEFEVQIGNPRKAYLELIAATNSYSLDDLKERLMGRMMSYIEKAIAQGMREKQLSYDKFSEYKNEIADVILPILSNMFTQDYGLKMFSFTISRVMLSEDYIRAIEAELANRKKMAEDEVLQAKEEQKQRELKEEQKKLEEEQRLREKEEKAEQRELERERRMDEERLDDKEWEREKWLLELKSSDYEKYLDVIKALGRDPMQPVSAPAAPTAPKAEEPKAAFFCPGCGNPLKRDDRFCPNCGKPVGDQKKYCPDCHKENPADAKFCSGCGRKI